MNDANNGTDEQSGTNSLEQRFRTLVDEMMTGKERNEQINGQHNRALPNVTRRQALGLLSAGTGVTGMLGSTATATASTQNTESMFVLDPNDFREYLGSDPEAAWVRENVPFFDCPDEDMLEIYYFRWLVFNRRLKKTPEGYVVEEFPFPVYWSNKYNTIPAAAGHHIREGRWLRDATYMNDYARFWFTKGVHPRHYSFWAADAVWSQYQVHNNDSLIRDLLQDLVYNYRQWESVHQDPGGLFWQYDDRDGMEHQAGGSGYRPTINSYMYGGATAIAEMAGIVGCDSLARDYRHRATEIQTAVQNRLWNTEDQFFETIYRGPDETDDREPDETVGIREEIGFVPWYFDLPNENQGYEVAWKQLTDPQGFHAPYGPTTVERRSPDFRVTNDCCYWDGTSWPFATTQTLVALANLLNNYGHQHPGQGRPSNRLPLDEHDYFNLLKRYTKTHHKTTNAGKRIPWIGPSVNPLTGEWTSDIEDYMHSSYTDLIISGLIGLRPRADNVIEVNPLVPFKEWEYFAIDNVRYHGHDVTIVYDRNGQQYGIGQGLQIYVDGEQVAKSGDPKLRRLTAELPDNSSSPSLRSCPEDTMPPGRTVDELTINVSHGIGPHPGIHASDNNPDTFWNSGRGRSEHWVQMTFPTEKQLRALLIDFQNSPVKYDVRYRSDGTWISASNQLKMPESPEAGENLVTFDEITTDRIRLVCDEGTGMYSSSLPSKIAELDWYDDLSDLPAEFVEMKFEDQSSDGESVNISSVFLPEGGFVGMYEGVIATASFTNRLDSSAEAIDGTVSYQDTPRNRWTSYGSPNESDWLQVSFPHNRSFTALKLYVYDDGGGVQPPEDYTVQYWNGTEWVTVPNQQQSPQTPQAKRNTVTFDPVTTNQFRIVFEHSDPDSNVYSGVTEIEWVTEEKRDSDTNDRQMMDSTNIIGVSDYLEPGLHESVSTTLFDVPGTDTDRTKLSLDRTLVAILHRDTNNNNTFDYASSSGDADGPYTVNDTIIKTTGFINL